MYAEGGVIYYAVDNTPTMFPYTVTKVLSERNTRIFDEVIEENITPALDAAMVIENGYMRRRASGTSARREG